MSTTVTRTLHCNSCGKTINEEKAAGWLNVSTLNGSDQHGCSDDCVKAIFLEAFGRMGAMFHMRIYRRAA